MDCPVKRVCKLTRSVIRLLLSKHRDCIVPLLPDCLRHSRGYDPLGSCAMVNGSKSKIMLIHTSESTDSAIGPNEPFSNFIQLRVLQRPFRLWNLALHFSSTVVSSQTHRSTSIRQYAQWTSNVGDRNEWKGLLDWGRWHTIRLHEKKRTRFLQQKEDIGRMMKDGVIMLITAGSEISKTDTYTWNHGQEGQCSK